MSIKHHTQAPVTDGGYPNPVGIYPAEWNGAHDIEPGTIALADLAQEVLDAMPGPQGPPGDASAAYPIGSVYLTVRTANPATLLGFGTWTELSDPWPAIHAWRRTA